MQDPGMAMSVDKLVQGLRSMTMMTMSELEMEAETDDDVGGGDFIGREMRKINCRQPSFIISSYKLIRGTGDWTFQARKKT
jgi:hypothetical protein